MTTTTTPAAVLAAEVKRLANVYADTRVLATRARAFRQEVEEDAGNLHAAIDRLREMAEGAQGEPVAVVSEVCGCGPNDVGVRWRGSFAKPGMLLYAPLIEAKQAEDAA